MIGLLIKKNKSHFIAIFVIFFVLACHAQNKSQIEKESPTSKILDEAIAIRYQKPDSAIVLLDEAHEQALLKHDTILAIRALLEMPFIYGQQVNYNKSYDVLWHALSLADAMDDEAQKANIYGELGRLYSFFKRKEEALDYLETSIEIKKNLIRQGKLDGEKIVENYYLYCSTYRELNEPKMARVYLDSSFLAIKSYNDQIERPYLRFEKAYVLSQEHKNEEALLILDEIESWFQENRPSYLVLVYTYWGDIFTQLQNYEESEKKYKMALEISKNYNSHIDFTPLIYEKLSSLYLTKFDYKNALSTLNKAKELDAEFFDSRSPRNRPLLEIKDQFRQEKEEQEKILQQQHVAQLEQADKISFLQRIILLGTLLFLVIIGWLYIKSLRSKHKAEKQRIQENKELEIRKTREILALNNKEMAASALQLVAKDELLRELQIKLIGENGQIEAREVTSLIKSISANSNNSWEEFKLRFIEVNDDFYQRLTQNYPKLSQSDHKVCALIKLNFSSKDMARLLGISVESVHTKRYRLRKKMGLERSDNLEGFIADL